VANRKVHSSAKSERWTLDNGMKLIVVPTPGAPYVSMQLGFLHGAWTESKPGTASLAAQMLTKGTNKHSDKELADELETYAINLTGNASLDATTINAGALVEHLPRAMALLAEVVRSPRFPEDEFEKTRKQVLTGLAISAKEPTQIAERALSRTLFGKHPYARTATGERDDVSALTAEDLREWWRSFARPDRAVLLIAGGVTAADAQRLATEALGDWKVEAPMPTVKLAEPPAPEPTRIILVDQPGAIQSQIRIGHRAFRRDYADYAVGRVVSDYFGGSFSSRLNEVIRVQKGLTYGARGGFNAVRFDGTFIASTFSKTDSTAAAVRAALDEIDRLRREAPSEAELGDTKANFIGKVALQRETPQQIANELWHAELYGLPTDHLDRTIARASALSPEECLSLAREWVDPAKLVVIVVGSAEELKAALEKIAPVTVVPAK
jgi:zinc protease